MAYWLISTLLLVGTSTLAFNIRLVKGQVVIYIRPDGSIDPPTAAIERNGDIYTFTDNIYDAIYVNKSNIKLDGVGFTLQGLGTATEAHGIELITSNTTITNLTITAWSTGIYLEGSSNNAIMENNIRNNGQGIDVRGTSVPNPNGPWGLIESLYNTISRNSITGNVEGVGCTSSNNTISENIITFNGWSGVCIGGFPGVSKYNIVSRNQITNSEWGVVLSAYARYNTISLNEIFNNTQAGIYISGNFAEGNFISGNNITHNVNGIKGFHYSAGNKIHHNNFIDNGEQVFFWWGPSNGAQVWDDDYPSGGNYWSNYLGTDGFSGPNQDVSGRDGIGDTPYLVYEIHITDPLVVDLVQQDHYPLMNPWTPTPPTIMATVNLDPDTLNLRSKGKWITAYIQLPEGYNPEDIDASTILLNGTIQPVLDPKYGFVTNSSEYLVDHNNDGVLERMVKFDRAAVASWIYQSVGMEPDVSLAITGKLFDGTPFEGTDTISAFWTGQRSPCKR